MGLKHFLLSRLPNAILVTLLACYAFLVAFVSFLTFL